MFEVNSREKPHFENGRVKTAKVILEALS
jgi:hypothetical protein